MATDFEQFKQAHEEAMKKVELELEQLLPSDLENLAKHLKRCRKNSFNYQFEEKETPCSNEPR